MPITKSNKHKLSLDHDKPNEEGGCTLATPYALMRSLILDYQISITPLGSCTPLYTIVFLQLNKWARELVWTRWRSINTPTHSTSHLMQVLQTGPKGVVHTNTPWSNPHKRHSVSTVSEGEFGGSGPKPWSGRHQSDRVRREKHSLEPLCVALDQAHPWSGR
jgi:hypothetical protein